jgi:hypothetical protein
MFSNREKLIAELDLAKKRVALYSGMGLGGYLALVLWGYDAIILTSSHGYLSWLKLAIGLLISITLGGFIGWLAVRSGRLLISTILWLFYGLIITSLVSVLPYQVMNSLIRFLNPLLGKELNYPPLDNFGATFALTAFIAAVATLLTGVLFDYMVESATHNPGILNRIVLFLVPLFLLGVMGFSLDLLYNAPMRTPVQVMSESIQTARIHPELFTARPAAGTRSIYGLRPIRQVLGTDYQISVAVYEPLLENIQLLVDFDGIWANCSESFGRINYCSFY